MDTLSLKWQQRFIRIAREISTWSKDRSTKHGTVIINPTTRAILSTGYNGFPEGIDDNDDALHERPLKYSYAEHSERNAIYHCSRAGVPTEGCALFVTGWPCPDCARGIVRSGIKAVYIDGDSIGGDFDTRWKEVTKISEVIFNKAGVQVVIVDMKEMED